MKLEEFLKLQNDGKDLEKRLVSMYGHSDVSTNDVWNKIYFKVEEYIAQESDNQEIEDAVIAILAEYELRTPELEKKTKSFMEKLGFKFNEDEQ